MARFLLVFTTVLVILFYVELLGPVQRQVVVPFTGLLAASGAWLITLFDASVVSFGKILQFQDTGFAISIESGCNGVEATIVLVAAVVAFPAPWRYRIGAILVGFCTIQVLNILRIVTLLYLGDWNHAVFSWVHLYLWPALIMLDVVLFFLLYLRWLSARESTARA